MASYSPPPPPSYYYPEPFESGQIRARLAMGFLSLNMALRLAGIVSLLWQINLLYKIASGVHISTADATANDDRQRLIMALQSLVYIIAAVFFLIWIYRVYRNLKALKQYPEYSAGWSVGYFFIPFVNFVRPYQIVQEIWQKSDPETVGINTTRQPLFDGTTKSPLVSGWWALWLFANLVGWIALLTARSAKSVADITTASWIGLVADVISIFAAIMCMLVIKQINERQEERYQRLQMISAPPNYYTPPPMPGNY